MSVHTFYRIALWLPLAVPAAVVLVVSGLGLRPDGGPALKVVQLLLASLVYGGVPYTVAALAASFWLGARSEREIRRLALRAPFWVIAACVPFVAFIAIRARSLPIFAGVMGLSIAATLVLGYAYVGIVFLLRDALGRAGVIQQGGQRRAVVAG